MRKKFLSLILLGLLCSIGSVRGECAVTGTIYKFQTKSSLTNATDIADETVEITTSNYLQTLSGSAGCALSAHNESSKFQISSNGLKLADKSKSYLIINLGECQLKAGDVVKTIISGQNAYLCTEAKSSKSILTITKSANSSTYVSFSIGEDVEQSTFYLMSASNSPIIYYFEVLRPETITLDATTNGGSVNNTTVKGLSEEKVVLPHAFKPGYKFKGWYTAATGGVKQEDYYTVSSATTLYAQFEDLPTSGTMFSFAMDDDLKPSSDVTIKTAEGFVGTQDMIKYATISGGSAIASNSSSNNHVYITTDPYLQFSGSNACLTIKLESALRVGDKITTTITNQNIAYTTTNTRTTSNNFTKGNNQELTLTDGHALVDATTIYLWSASSSGGKLSSLTITRPIVYSVTYDLDGGKYNGSTDAPTQADVVSGAKITLPSLTPTKDGYTFEGWTCDIDDLDYAANAEYTMTAANTTFTAHWEVYCAAGDPGDITKGTLSAGTLTLNAAGSAADGDTWYWQTAEDGELKTNSGSSYDVTAAGTYYVRSYNTSANCWSDAKSIAVTASDLLLDPEPTFNNGEYIVGGSALDLSTLFSSSNTASVTYTVTDANETGATIAGTNFSATTKGTATVKAEQVAYGGYANVEETATITVYANPLGSHTITYTLDVPPSSENNSKKTINSTDESSSLYLKSLVGITNNTGGQYGTGDKKNLTVKIPTPASYDADNYMSVGFTVESGYRFVPSSISVKAQPVATDKAVKLVLTDGVNSIEKTQASLAEGSITPVTMSNNDNVSFTGNVTLKIYCYGADDTYRLGSPITIAGIVSAVPATVSTTISSVGWNTFSSSYPLDLSDLPSGLKAYKVEASKVDLANSTITLTEVNEAVPAGTGLLLKGTASTGYSIPTTASADAVSDNKLVACVAQTTLAKNANYYVLVNNSGAEFQSLENQGATVGAGKAYLDLTGVTLAADRLRIVFEENNATALETIETNDSAIKFFENGQLYIKREGVVCDVTGRMVR